MANEVPPESKEIQVRRYPNRRYYNATHSQHVTLEAIYELILAGNDVQVTDSKTGEDITAKVLTQIILEHEAPKLDAFPVGLLHRLIRTNEPIVREFVEKYFSQAFSAFVDSHRQLSDYLRESMGLGSAAATVWPQAMWGPFEKSSPNATDDNSETTHVDDASSDDADLRLAVEKIQEQVRKLREEMNSD